jgi:hypothetical protein
MNFDKLILLLITTLLISCGEKSTIGNWTESEKAACIEQGTLGLDLIKEGLLLHNKTTVEEFVSCNCEELEKRLESYTEFEHLTPADLLQDYAYDTQDCLNYR